MGRRSIASSCQTSANCPAMAWALMPSCGCRRDPMGESSLQRPVQTRRRVVRSEERERIMMGEGWDVEGCPRRGGGHQRPSVSLIHPSRMARRRSKSSAVIMSSKSMSKISPGASWISVKKVSKSVMGRFV